MLPNQELIILVPSLKESQGFCSFMGGECHYLLYCGTWELQLRCKSHCVIQNQWGNPCPTAFAYPQSQIARLQGLWLSVFPLLNPQFLASQGSWAEFFWMSFCVLQAILMVWMPHISEAMLMLHLCTSGFLGAQSSICFVSLLYFFRQTTDNSHNTVDGLRKYVNQTTTSSTFSFFNKFGFSTPRSGLLLAKEFGIVSLSLTLWTWFFFLKHAIFNLFFL